MWNWLYYVHCTYQQWQSYAKPYAAYRYWQDEPRMLNSEDVRDEVGLRDDTAFKNCNDPIDFTACEVFLRFPASSGG